MLDNPLKLAIMVAAFMTLWRFVRSRRPNRRLAVLPIAQRRSPRRPL